MNYVETGGYSGELFAVFDNFGNIANLLDDSGLSKWATIYDLNNRYYDERWKVPDITVPFGWNGKNGDITIQVGTDRDLIINSVGSNFSITNPWGAIGDQDWAKPPKTNKGGGDGDEPCDPLPANPCTGKAKDYRFSYASIEYIIIDYDLDGKPQYIGQLAKSQKERLRDAGFSDKTIFFTGF